MCFSRQVCACPPLPVYCETLCRGTPVFFFVTGWERLDGAEVRGRVCARLMTLVVRVPRNQHAPHSQDMTLELCCSDMLSQCSHSLQPVWCRLMCFCNVGQSIILVLTQSLLNLNNNWIETLSRHSIVSKEWISLLFWFWVKCLNTYLIDCYNIW